MKKLFLFIVFPSALFFNSCRKTDTKPQQTTPAISAAQMAVFNKIKADAERVLTSKSNGSSTGRYSVDPSNPNNPYDYIGANHNAILDYIISYASNLKSASSLTLSMPDPVNPTGGEPKMVTYSTFTDKVTGLSEQYSINNFDAYENGYPTTQNQLFNTMSTDANFFVTNPYKSIDPANFSITESGYILSLANNLQNFNDGSISAFEIKVDTMLADQLLTSCTDLASVINLIKVYDSDIQAGTIDPSIMTRQLYCYSIMRYSCAYWEAVSEDASNPWMQFMPSWFTDGAGERKALRTTKLKWWQWGLVGLADGVGGLAGTAATGGLGAFIGGAVGGVCSGVVQDLFS